MDPYSQSRQALQALANVMDYHCVNSLSVDDEGVTLTIRSQHHGYEDSEDHQVDFLYGELLKPELDHATLAGERWEHSRIADEAIRDARLKELAKREKANRQRASKRRAATRESREREQLAKLKAKYPTP